ncbi:MAG: GAF domain-containing protein [Nibricoccus sp.]
MSDLKMHSTSASERAQVLAEYQIIGTPPETAYDEITDIASKVFECPIALVVLLDEKRQWYKSRIGMDVPENPLDNAFCTHTIMEPDMLVVPDATKDSRFADNPFVSQGSGIRFYAGVPLVSASGVALGSLCVIDRKPHNITDVQSDVLRSLGKQVVELFEKRRATLSSTAPAS